MSMPIPLSRTALQSTVACAVAAYLFVKLVSWRRETKRLPPGPPKLPFIDNLHNMPAGLDWVRFEELGKEYGSDIIHLSALGNSIVVLNSYDTAREILDKRSGIYSSRPPSILMGDLGGCNVFFSITPYGDYWRECRKMFIEHLGPRNTHLHQPREIKYVRRFLYQLASSPEKFLSHIRYFVGAVSISETYGLEPKIKDDPSLQLIEDFVGYFGSVLTAGTYLVDVFPSLKHLPTWFPGTGFHQVGTRIAGYAKRSREVLLKQSFEAMKEPNYAPSFVSEVMQDIEENTQGAERTEALTQLECTAAQVYIAGGDTTSSAIATFVLAMVCYPEVQKKLQQELDSILDGRLPSHNDLESLPYLNAVVMEVFRWKPVARIGVPHQVITDDIYNGYYIPKESVVLANVWAMSYNTDVYPEPHIFRPERFLKDGKIDESVLNPIDIIFGFGRRICPGKHLAQSLLTLTAASILTVFDLNKAKGQDGKVIEPTQEYHEGLVSHPKPFPCVIQPRSLIAHEIIQSCAPQED